VKKKTQKIYMRRAILLCVGLVVGAWWWVPNGASWVHKLLEHNMIVQSMFGTSLAAALVAAVHYMATLGMAWSLGSLSTTFRVPAPAPPPAGPVPGSLHDMVWRFMASAPAMQMPVATASFVPERLLSAAQRFAALAPGLVRKAEGSDRSDCSDRSTAAAAPVVTFSVEPAMLPITVQFMGATIVMTKDPKSNDITLRTAGRGRHALMQSFLQGIVTKAHLEDVARGAKDTEPVSPTLFRAVITPDLPEGRWAEARSLRGRAASTLHLPKGVLEGLIADAVQFFSSAAEYKQTQKPYRRGVCVDGPPGVGKSCLAVCVATEVGKLCGASVPVCVLPMGHPLLTDMNLDALLNQAPVPGFVVLEDVDAALDGVAEARAGEARAGEGVGSAVGPPWDALASALARTGTQGRARVNNVTLAGLLNALDGVGAHEGHIVFMTTNHKHKLDGALLRKGRCDVQTHLPLADRHQVRSMFKAAFPEASEEDVAKFVASVREDRFSPASLSEFLMRVRGDLAAALDARQLPLQDKAGLLPGDAGSMLLRRIARSSDSMFDMLWGWGCEELFPWALAEPRQRVLTAQFSGLVLFEMDPVSCPVIVSQMRELLTRNMAEDLFLAVFSWHEDALALAVEFVRTVWTWCEAGPGRLFCKGRLVRHLAMNCDCPRRAIACAGDWLLTYARTDAHRKPVWSRKFALYFFGRPPADPDAASVEAQLGAAGLRSGLDVFSMMLGCKLPEEVMKHGDNSMGLKRLLVGHAGIYTDFGQACNRRQVADCFLDSFENQGVTQSVAMDAARLVTGPGGRSGFSLPVLARLIGCSSTLKECLARMLQDQKDNDFPDLFRASVQTMAAAPAELACD